MTGNEAHAEAVRRIDEAARTGARVLDLGDLPLAELPEELGRLRGLEVLALGTFKVTVNGARIDWSFEPERPTRRFRALHVLAGLASLQTLTLRGCAGVSDVSPLAGLASLQILDLSGCAGVSDVSPLSGLASLQCLDLRRCVGVSDLSPLSGLASLQTLILGECAGVSDLSPLSGLASLQILNLSRCAGVRNLSPLSGLASLRSLDLSWFTGVSDLSPLAGLASLQSLSLSWCLGVSDLSPLAGLASLRSLDLSRCDGVSDLSPLAGLTSLQSLDLRKCDGVSDLSPLSGLTSLQSLDLRGAGRRLDLSPLRRLMDRAPTALTVHRDQEADESVLRDEEVALDEGNEETEGGSGNLGAGKFESEEADESVLRDEEVALDEGNEETEGGSGNLGAGKFESEEAESGRVGAAESKDLRPAKSARPVSPAPPPLTDNVTLAVFGPAVVVPDSDFTLDVWAYLPEYEPEVRASLAPGTTLLKDKTPVRLQRGTELSLLLELTGFEVRDPADVLYWDGTRSTAGFPVHAPAGLRPGGHNGTVKVFVHGLQIAKIHFTLQVGTHARPAAALPCRSTLHRTAFASYASQDRDAVLTCVQGIQKVVPQLDVFLDVHHLRSGEEWRERIQEEVCARDVLYLFWSAHARRSHYVEWEWRVAFKQKGLAGIDPVPLADPEEVAPPPELSALHFRDWVLPYKRRHRAGSGLVALLNLLRRLFKWFSC